MYTISADYINTTVIIMILNLLIHLKDTFFDTAVGSRPNLHAYADGDETGSHLKKNDPPHPILIETRSYRRPLYRPLYVDKSAMRRFASLFGEVLLYQHQRIVTMTKLYIASNNLPVEIIRFHTIGFSDV